MRILLVDDDEAILQSLAVILKSLPGHEVRQAGGGEEALKLAEEMGGLDLLVTDVVMDPMDGFALRDTVAERHPSARTIFLTGYDLSDYAEQTANHPLLQKPFEPADVLAAIRKELGDGAMASEPPQATAPVAAEPVAAIPAAEPEPEPAAAPPTPHAPEPEPVEPIAATPAPVAPATPPEPAPEPSAPPTPIVETPATPDPVPQIAASAPAPVAAAIAPPAPAPAVEAPASEPPAAPSNPTPTATPSTPAVPVARLATPTAPSMPATPRAVPVAPVAPGQPVPVARPVVQQPRPGQPVPRATTPTAAPATATPTAAPGQRPIARPVAAQPTAVGAPAVPRATVVPVARPAGAPPTAVPQARAATPSAVPGAPARAVPTAAPSPAASPKSTQPIARANFTAPGAPAKSTQPIAVPAANAAPVAVPRPAVAVAVAAGAAVVAKAVAAPAAAAGSVPNAQGAPAPAAKATAIPIAKPTGAPVAKAGLAPAQPAGPRPAAVAAVGSLLAPTPPDTANLPAKTIGSYDIHHRLGVGRWGAVYAAVQTAINRPVALKILDPERAKDEAAVQSFTADARAKAGVQHPSILAVYEAGEQDGHIFYTREYVAGRNLAELEKSGGKIDEATAVKVLRVVGEGLGYLQSQNTPHAPLEARSIYLGGDGQPRLANLASHSTGTQQTFHQQVQTLGKVLLGVLPAAQTLSPGLRNLLGRMVQAAEGNAKSFPAWPPILHAVKSLEPQIVPIEASKISAGDRAAVAAVEAARKAQQRSIYLTIGSGVSLLLLVGALVWYFFFHGSERDHEEMIQIPGGEFLFQSGEKATVPEFWIDKYEVTIGQYAEFLAYLEEHPRGQYPDVYDRIEHPNQPPLKRVENGHRPPNWHIFHPRAERKMEVAGTLTSLNSPVVEVDWWSAFAYAKWRGHELPTEQEWEKTARGTKGFLYPWGEQPDPKRANTGADYHEGNPTAKAELDGFIRYGDVDQQTQDKSEYGVIGMAGNVSEWILDWAIGPDKRTKYPMVKGGNFRDPEVKLDRRILDRRPDATHDWLGFRTVSHSAPKK